MIIPRSALMEDIFQEIVEKIKARNVIFFVAAGVSYDYPASLPIANTLFEEIFLSIFDDVIDKQELLNTLKNKLRFEVFFQIFTDLFGKKAIDLLDILRLGKPNHNHIFLSELAKNKFISTILTTNFDSLIEQEFQKNKIKFSLLYKDIHFKNYKSTTGVQILKLHGSFVDKDKTDVSDSILISVNQVGKKVSKLKKNTLKKLLTDKDIIFIGYSGMDDFDILPIFLTTKSDKSIYWINHKISKDLVHYSAIDLEKCKPDSLNYNYGKILNNRKKGFLIEGETKLFTKILSEKLLNKNIVTKAAYNKPKYDFSYLNQWKNQIKTKDKLEYLRGLILDIIGDYKGAIKYFDKVEISSEIYFNAMLQKSISLSHSGNSLHAKLLLKNIINTKNLSQEMLLKCLIQIGLIEAEANNFKISRRYLTKAIRIKTIDNYDLAKLMNNLGVSYLIESEVLKNRNESKQKIKYRLYKALGYFKDSKKISRKFSNYYHYANLDDNIALTYTQLKQFHKAKSGHFKALTAYRALYQYREEASCLDNIGIFYKEQADYLTALKYFHRALFLKKKYSTQRRIALTIHNIAVLYFDAKKYKYSYSWAQDALSIFKSENLFGYASATKDLIYRINTQLRNNPSRKKS